MTIETVLWRKMNNERISLYLIRIDYATADVYVVYLFWTKHKPISLDIEHSGQLSQNMKRHGIEFPGYFMNVRNKYLLSL